MTNEELSRKLEQIKEGSGERLTKDEASLIAQIAVTAINLLVNGYSLSPLSQKKLFMFTASQLDLFTRLPL